MYGNLFTLMTMQKQFDACVQRIRQGAAMINYGEPQIMEVF